MNILEYKYSDSPKNQNSSWNYDQVDFKRHNLIVGDTATGKSKFLNTIFNLKNFILSGEFHSGIWDIRFEQDSIEYHYELNIYEKERKPYVEFEKLTYKDIDNTVKEVVKRELGSVWFLGSKLPSELGLTPHESLIKIVDNDSNIKNVKKLLASY